MSCDTKYLTGSSWNNKEVSQGISKKTLMLMFYEIFVAKLSYYWIDWAGAATWHTWTNIEEGIVDSTLFSNWLKIQKTICWFPTSTIQFWYQRRRVLLGYEAFFSPYFYWKT